MPCGLIALANDSRCSHCQASAVSEARCGKRMLGGLLSGTLCLNDLLDRLVEYRYLVFHNVPDNAVINSKVAMDQSVTHTSHRSPFQVTVLLLEVIWYLL
jgi:hypothetical protein